MATENEEDAVTQDLGGVQGTSDDDQDVSLPGPSTVGAEAPDRPAPDAGEIEWAGALVKKPPAPAN